MPIVGIGLRLCARRISRPSWQNGSWNQPGISPNPAFQNPRGETFPHRGSSAKVFQGAKMNIEKRKTAPLSAIQLKQLKVDAKNIRTTAERKQVTLDQWEERDETFHAKQYFELGCWLFYYSSRIYKPEGLADRIDCMRRIFEAGLTHLNYEFFTVFDFGSRQFDTLVEMGDATAVIDGVRKHINDSEEGLKIREAFQYMGWPIETQGSLL